MKKRKLLYAVIFVEVILILLTIVLYNPFFKITLIGNQVVKVPVGTEYVDKGVKARYFKEDLTEQVKKKGEVNTNVIGEYEIEYLVAKGNKVKKVFRKVIVADLTSPDIILNGNHEVVLCGKEYVEEGYTATDNVDGDLTSQVQVKKLEDKIIYEVSDKSGNKKQVVRNLIANDNVKPTINILNSDILTFKQGSDYKEFGATAIDNCDGDISSKIEIISNVDTNKHEIFEVIYKVKDLAGNETIAKRKIKIYNNDDLNKPYTETIEGPTYIKNILIVNKKYSLPKDFKTDNKEALEALAKLQADAKKAGYNIPTKSGYRSYESQERVYERFKKSYGQEYADARAARPGFSEHQTGLSFDIGLGSVVFGTMPEGIWLKENCAKYGFIIRYPQYKEAITGYGYEPWHVRYVGEKVATEIMKKEITLEEYLGIYDIND